MLMMCGNVYAIENLGSYQIFVPFFQQGKDWFTTWLALTDVTPVVGTSFSLLPFIDIGGTLSISVHLDELIMVRMTLLNLQL